MPKHSDEQHYLIEYRAIGTFVKVCAVDPLTNTEISVVMPKKGFIRSDANRLASARLNYVLKKKARQAAEASNPALDRSLDPNDSNLY